MPRSKVGTLVTLAALAGITLAIARPAQAQVTFGLGAGPTLPAGTLSDYYTTGFNALVNVGVRVPSFPLGFRVDGMFDQLPVKTLPGFSGHTQIYSASANAVLTTTGTPIIAPYLIGGVGYYNDHYRVNVSGTSVSAGGSTSDNDLGINGGGGLRFGVAMLSVFAEIRFHYVFAGPNHLELVPITFGVMF